MKQFPGHSVSPIAAIRFAELQAIRLDSKADSTNASILKDMDSWFECHTIAKDTPTDRKNVTLGAI